MAPIALASRTNFLRAVNKQRSRAQTPASFTSQARPAPRPARWPSVPMPTRVPPASQCCRARRTWPGTRARWRRPGPASRRTRCRCRMASSRCRGRRRRASFWSPTSNMTGGMRAKCLVSCPGMLGVAYVPSACCNPSQHFQIVRHPTTRDSCMQRGAAGGGRRWCSAGAGVGGRLALGARQLVPHWPARPLAGAAADAARRARGRRRQRPGARSCRIEPLHPHKCYYETR